MIEELKHEAMIKEIMENTDAISDNELREVGVMPVKINPYTGEERRY